MNNCAFCEKPLSEPSTRYGGEILHDTCYVQLGAELHAHDRQANGERMDCDHCKMPIYPNQPTWASFDVTIHESCKSEHLLVMAFPRESEIPRCDPRLWRVIKSWINLILPE